VAETFNIAGYCRISVDDELDKDNTSIENQKAIIEDYVTRTFPNGGIEFFEDRDRSGYTFEQRDGYQLMRKKLMSGETGILIIKDFSRFSRRNGRGLVELEDLRDAGVRIISIGDGIDYPTNDDWLAIQLHFFINEMPVTDTSKKVKNVIKRRQADGKWICAVPYGYVITNTKNMTFEIDEPSAEVVRMVFRLYNDGWGYKKIANRLTDLKIPTPRMVERERIEARGEECKIKAKPEWSIITIQGMLENDFYIGTLRQGKYTRKKINGSDMKKDVNEHIVFENNHPAVIDYRTYAITVEQRKNRTVTNYRGVKIHDNPYSGFIYCGDCGSPMFSMSRSDLKPAYICGTYHKRGLKGCTSHHTRADMLDKLLKSYIRKVKDNSKEMIAELELALKSEPNEIKSNGEIFEKLENMLISAQDELKATKRQKIREIMRRPEQEGAIEEIYAELEAELESKITGFQNQIDLSVDKRNNIIKANRAAKTALDIFDDILDKKNLNKNDLEFIINRINVFNEHIEIKLKSDIDAILSINKNGEQAANFPRDTEDNKNRIVQSAKNRKDKVFRVNVISSGDPLEIFTDKDGEVIFKKYSAVGELINFATQYAEALNKTSGHSAAITDRDAVIAVSGNGKKDILDKKISKEVEKAMGDRVTTISSPVSNLNLPLTEGSDKFMCGIIVPIISEGDAIGAVILFTTERNATMGDIEEKLASTAAAVLGKMFEN
jgi:stage V sporulation protein T